MSDGRKRIEREILGALVLSLTDQGFRVELCDGDGDGLYLYAVPDGGEKPDGGFEYWVRIVDGNGTDMISDYSTNIEPYILDVLNLIGMLEKIEA